MSRTFKSMAVMMGVCVVAVSSVFALTMPFTESFESYADGQSLNGVANGWGSDSNRYNETAMASILQAQGGTKSAELPTVVTLSNTANIATATNVWSDFWVKPVFFSPEPTDPGYPYPTLDGGATAMFYVNSNGYLVVAQISAGATNWQVVTSSVSGAPVAPVGAGWVRLSVNSRYGANKWAILKDGLVLREGLNFIAASAPTAYQKFQVYNGSYATTFVDNVSISTNLPAGLTGDYDGDGMNDAWEIQFFGSTTSTNQASGDADGDGSNNGEESQYATDPYNPSSFQTGSFVIPYQDQFDLLAYGPINGRHGWGDSLGNMIVTNSVVYSGTKAVQVGYGELTLTNFIADATYTNIWTDMMLKPGRMYWDATSATKADTTAAFYIDTNGLVMARSGIAWVALTNYLGGLTTNFSPIVIDTNDWTRFIVKTVYTGPNLNKWWLYMITNALATPNAMARMIGDGLAFAGTPSQAYYQGMSLTNFNSANYAGALDQVYVTNAVPPMVDTDGDGVPDYFEDQYNLPGMTNSTQDTDGDGLTDLQEFVMGTDPTNPGAYMHITSADILSPGSPDVALNLEIGHDRVGTLFASDTPEAAPTWTPIGNFSIGLYDTSATVTNLGAVTSTDRRFYQCAVNFAGLSVTNGNRYAMYRQARAKTNEYYRVGIPVDYKAGSNTLNSALGQQLARGLYTGNSSVGDQLALLYGNANWSNFWLNVDGTWRYDPGTVLASNEILPGQSVMIFRKGLGTAPATSNTVFVGLARSGDGVPVVPPTYSLEIGQWQLVTWPYDVVTSINSMGLTNGQTSTIQTNRDVIWIVGSQGYVELELWTNRTWRYVNGQQSATNTFGPNDWFYYNGKGPVFTWQPAKP